MSSRGAPRRGWKTLIPITAATITLSAGIGIATGQSGGGGISPPNPPKANDVECIQDCAGPRRAGEGSLIRVIGNNLGNVVRVGFRTADGWQGVEPNFAGGQRVRATVPEGTVTGRVRVFDNAGNRSATPNQLRIVNASELSDGNNFKLSSAEAAPRKTYFFANPNRRPSVAYYFNGEGATDIRIQVLRMSTGRVVRSWVQSAREPGVRNVARWNGRNNNGKLVGNGRYRFRFGAVGNGNVQTTADSRFRFYGHIFPVRGHPRGWGDGFGAGRGHQGQDLFASCGTPLVAARGGKVRYNRWHGAAGWYVVIGGQATGRDYMYAHLRNRSPVSPGDTVRTGQRIGRVGATGNASGCHLHFELWSSPGWYNGGSPMPAVTRHMRQWASWS